MTESDAENHGGAKMKPALDWLPEDAFLRLDETDDKVFYEKDRFVEHLDSVALATIQELIGQLVVEENPVILDLMAGWDSHLPGTLAPSKVVGLGLNRNELDKNGALTEFRLHDLNRDPHLPFETGTFNAVVCTASVDYLTRPVEVFYDVGRILKPGGLFLVIFSNRMFPKKAVKIWRESSEEERTILVVDYFRASRAFGEPRIFVSRGRTRPEDDKYAHLDIPSDPVYAVYAEKGSGPARRRIPVPRQVENRSSRKTIEDAKRRVGETLRCPYCDEPLLKWEVPDTPFTEWPNEFMYVCFNDACSYFVKGWEIMAFQGNPGSYRFSYDTLRNTWRPFPVLTRKSGREGIIRDPSGGGPQ